MSKGINDIFTNMQERYNQRDQVVFSDWGKIKQSIVQEVPPTVSKEKVDEMIVLARVLEQVFAKTMFISKDPAHITPPWRAIPVDMYKNVALNILPAPGWIQVLRLVVRPGQYVVINGFANECENLAAHEEVQWTIRINNQDVVIQTEWFDGGGRDSSYRIFNERLGLVENPFMFPRAFDLLGPAEFAVFAQNTSLINPHDIRARVTGYAFTPGQTSLDRDAPVQIMS